MIYAMIYALIVWGLISFPAGFLAGKYLKWSRTPSKPLVSMQTSRSQQHQHEAQTNPNYRGGFGKQPIGY